MAERTTAPRHDCPTLEQAQAMIATSVGLSDDQLAQYTALLPALLTAEVYRSPAAFDYQLETARELSVWMTSDEFYRLKAAV